MSNVRYRCAACGNLTRFDVTVSRRTRAFHHFTVGGELSIEAEDVLSEQVEQVSCRWCGSARAVEELGAGAGDEAGVEGRRGDPLRTVDALGDGVDGLRESEV